MSLTRYVPVTVNRALPSVSQAGFGTLLSVFQIDAATLPAQYTSFSSPTEVAASGLPANVLAAGAVFFQQNPNAGTWIVGRRVPGTAQVDTITVTTADAGTWSYTIDGFAVSYVAGALDTEQDIAEGLAAAAEAVILANGLDIATSTPVAGVYTHTSNVAGDTFTTAAFTPGGAGAGSAANTTPSVAAEVLTTCLDAIEAAGADFYGLTIEDRDDADILLAASWTASRRKIFCAQTADPTLLSATGGNICAQLVALNRSRTFVIYNEDSREFSDVAWMSLKLSMRLDQEHGTWAFAQLAGVTSSSLTSPPISSAELDNVQDERGNFFATTAGLSHTYPGQNTGSGTSALFIDQVTSEDWTVSRIQEAVFTAIAGSRLGTPFNAVGRALIEGACRGVGNQGERAGRYNPGTFTVSVPDSTTLTPDQRASRTWPNVVIAYQETQFAQKVVLTIDVSV